MRVSSRTEPQTRWLRKGPLGMKTAADCATAAGRVFCGSLACAQCASTRLVFTLSSHMHTHIHTQTHAQTHTLSLTLTYETRPEFARTASSTHGSSVCWCVRLAAGGWQMLCAGSGRRLPVKHLLDTLVTLLKRACVRVYAVVMKLSTAHTPA